MFVGSLARALDSREGAMPISNVTLTLPAPLSNVYLKPYPFEI